MSQTTLYHFLQNQRQDSKQPTRTKLDLPSVRLRTKNRPQLPLPVNSPPAFTTPSSILTNGDVSYNNDLPYPSEYPKILEKLSNEFGFKEYDVYVDLPSKYTEALAQLSTFVSGIARFVPVSSRTGCLYLPLLQLHTLSKYDLSMAISCLEATLRFIDAAYLLSVTTLPPERSLRVQSISKNGKYYLLSNDLSPHVNSLHLTYVSSHVSRATSHEEIYFVFSDYDGYIYYVTDPSSPLSPLKPSSPLPPYAFPSLYCYPGPSTVVSVNSICPLVAQKTAKVFLNQCTPITFGSANLNALGATTYYVHPKNVSCPEECPYKNECERYGTYELTDSPIGSYVIPVIKLLNEKIGWLKIKARKAEPAELSEVKRVFENAPVPKFDLRTFVEQLFSSALITPHEGIVTSAILSYVLSLSLHHYINSYKRITPYKTLCLIGLATTCKLLTVEGTDVRRLVDKGRKYEEALGVDLLDWFVQVRRPLRSKYKKDLSTHLPYPLSVDDVINYLLDKDSLSFSTPLDYSLA